jgi:hypothetical protein
MNCKEAQEQMLESLAEAHPGAATPGLEAHLAGCEDCRSFRATQLLLDRELTAAISIPTLHPALRAAVLDKIRREPLPVWPEFLPDVAHLAGCVCATAVCLSLLPLPAGTVLLAGLAFTATTYVLQTAIGGSLEGWEEDR